MTLFLTSDPVDRPGTIPRQVSCPLKTENGFAERLRSYLPDPVRILFVEAAPDDFERNDSYMEYMREAFSLSGFQVAAIDVCDHRKTDHDPGDYDLVILGGGHVPTQNAFFREIALKERLKGYRGVVMGISAGTMNCARIVYAQPELPGEATDTDYERFIPGLGLTEYNLLPHYNAVKNDILDGMRLIEDIAFADSIGHTFYAITDGSYLLQTEDMSEIRGEAYMIRDGEIRQICTDGSVLKLQTE